MGAQAAPQVERVHKDATASLTRHGRESACDWQQETLRGSRDEPKIDMDPITAPGPGDTLASGDAGKVNSCAGLCRKFDNGGRRCVR